MSSALKLVYSSAVLLYKENHCPKFPFRALLIATFTDRDRSHVIY